VQTKYELMMTSKRAYGAAEVFVDQCVASGYFGFSLARVVHETGLSERAAREQLRRLGKRVVRPAQRQPFFLIKGSLDGSLGAPSVDRWLDDYFAWLGRPYYVALQSAAAIYGAQPQALQVTQIMTDAPRREVRVGRQRLRFFVKSNFSASLVQEAPRAFSPMKVSAPETTVFDLVRYAPRIGGISRAAETICPMLHLVRPAVFESLLKLENDVSATQRMGFLLAKLGHAKLASAAEKCLPPRRAWVPLAAGAGGEVGAARDRRWRVVENAQIP
jgi:hypothetical protein